MDAADKGDDVEAPPTPPPAKTGWLPKTVLALDVIGAFAGILVIITTIFNMDGLPIILGVFEVPVFVIPKVCDGSVDPTAPTGCLYTYTNVRWQVGIFSIMTLLAAFIPIIWVFRGASRFGAIHEMGDMLSKTTFAEAVRRILIMVPVATWFSLGIATLGMAGILGFAVGLTGIVLCFLYILIAFFE